MKGLAVGRIVHYTPKDGEHKAAVVSQIVDKDEGIVNLVVFTSDPAVPASAPPAESVFRVGYSEQAIAHSWHWIEQA